MSSIYEIDSPRLPVRPRECPIFHVLHDFLPVFPSDFVAASIKAAMSCRPGGYTSQDHSHVKPVASMRSEGLDNDSFRG